MMASIVKQPKGDWHRFILRQVLIKSECPIPIMWVDCGGQNKNCTLLTVLTILVNQEWGPECVIIRYLEHGHTFISVDSVHGIIGQNEKKKTTELFIFFSDLTELINKSSKHIKVVPMNVIFMNSSQVKRLKAQKSNIAST